jgi:hypothetical protein
MSNESQDYRGFTITWQDPPTTSAKWTANVASESMEFFNLIGGSGCKIIDAQTRNEMLASAQSYIDGLLARKRHDRRDAASVRDIFLEALSKKANDVPWPEIREHLINRGHDIGHSQIQEAGGERKYVLVFQTGEKISFDGADYHFTRA